MDALRSCYDTTMRFPGFGLVRVRWYWTNKPVLPYQHVYGSHNHIRDPGDEDGDNGQPGEVWGASRPYYSGNPLPGYPCKGPFGSADAWMGLTDSSSPSILVPSVIPVLGSGGWINDGAGYHPFKRPSGVGWDGSGRQGRAGSGGVAFGGAGREVSGSFGVRGVSFDGSGRQGATGSGGAAWDGSGRLAFTGSGGFELDGSGIRLERGNGGELFGGSGIPGNTGSGGVDWDGKGQQLARGGGGVLLDGSGIRLAIGSGGWQLDGTGIRLALGSGGIELDGSGIEGPVVTFSCGTLVAAGTTQSTASLITQDTLRLTSTGANQGVILPSGCYRVILCNVNSGGGNAIKVYPPSGAQIASLGLNNPFTLNAQAGILLFEESATQWGTISVLSI